MLTIVLSSFVAFILIEAYLVALACDIEALD
jgi:hypothetical protein